MATDALDLATRKYLAERGFTPTGAYELFNRCEWSPNQNQSRTITYGGDQWRAYVINWTGPNHLICSGPDPITCFITAELMNWSNPDA